MTDDERDELAHTLEAVIWEGQQWLAKHPPERRAGRAMRPEWLRSTHVRRIEQFAAMGAALGLEDRMRAIRASRKGGDVPSYPERVDAHCPECGCVIGAGSVDAQASRRHAA